MNLDLALKGALANLPDGGFSEAALLAELASHGLSSQDAGLALETAVLDGYVERVGGNRLSKRPRAFEVIDSGRP